ncbi:MAG: hypothetical protein FJ357_04785 [Thaumarchaeota archaeon]|nr:hypothetical protein [Nitrososphaerota archaeon]
MTFTSGEFLPKLMSQVWLGGIYLKEEGGYKLVLRALHHYKKRLRNIRKSPEIKDAPMFAQVIEQEAMKSYKQADSIITKISDGLQNPESLKTIEPDVAVIEKALTCYQSDITKINSDAFYSELITDKSSAEQDLDKIKSALEKITSYC